MAAMIVLMVVLVLTGPAHMGDVSRHAAPDQQQAPAAGEAARQQTHGRSPGIDE
jgi:hypothetical protein